MSKLLVFIIILVLALGGAAVYIYQAFGLSGLFIYSLTLLALVFGTKKLAGRLFKKFLLGLFNSKGKALKNAKLEVHKICKAPLPEPEDLTHLVMDMEPEEIKEVYKEQQALEEDWDSMQWYYLDLTITPDSQRKSTNTTEENAFTFWEPGELMLDQEDAKAGNIFENAENELSYMHDYRVWQAGVFVEDEEFKHEGAQRLQLHVGVQPGQTRFQLRYYFELLGEVAI